MQLNVIFDIYKFLHLKQNCCIIFNEKRNFVSFYARERRRSALRCIEWPICFSDVCRIIPFFFLFPSLRYFLHRLAVHTLYVTSPGYTLSGAASECDSVVKSWCTFYRPAGSKKVYYSLAIPGDLRGRESGICDSLTDRASENSQTCVDPLVAAGRWNSILRSRIGLSTRSTRRRALIESNSGSRKIWRSCKPHSRQHRRKIDGVTFPYESISIRNRSEISAGT